MWYLFVLECFRGYFVSIYCINNNPAGSYMFKVNNKNTTARCEMFSKLTIKTPERSSVFIVNFEHISHLVLAFLFLTLSRQMPAGK